MLDNIFITKKISEHTTWITDFTGSSCFLVEGSDNAVLLDSCSGLGDLRKLVASLTDKEVRVILTHGHADHIGGAGQFDEVYIAREDLKTAEHNDTGESKLFSASYNNPVLCGGLGPGDFCPPVKNGFGILEPGREFDLGDVVLKTIPVPGHTEGFTMVLNKTERLILFGDGCNAAVFLTEPEAAPVGKYLESLNRLKCYEDMYDRCLVSHGALYTDRGVLDGTIEVCRDVLKGEQDAMPYEYLGRQCFFARAVNEDLSRKDGGLGNILYTADKLL